MAVTSMAPTSITTMTPSRTASTISECARRNSTSDSSSRTQVDDDTRQGKTSLITVLGKVPFPFLPHPAWKQSEPVCEHGKIPFPYTPHTTWKQSAPVGDYGKGPFPFTPHPVWKQSDPVRILRTKNELKQATATLAEAFKSDAVARYFTHTSDRQTCTNAQHYRLHSFIMKCIVRMHCLSGMVTAVGPSYDSVALWMPPNSSTSFWDLLRSGHNWLNFRMKLSPDGLDRFFQEFMPLLHRVKHEMLGGRESKAWYLVYIGTKPASRGQGYASRLIEDAVRQADKRNAPIYLECSNDDNKQLYGKLGFEEKRRIYLERSVPPVPLDIMMREPKVQDRVNC